MDRQHFTDNGQQKFPLSTEALAFIQEQIELGYKLTNLAGQNIIIVEPTAAKEGLVIFDGELLPMAKGVRGSYTRIAISEQTESLSIEGFSGNVRTTRVAYYTNTGGTGEAKKPVSDFTTLKSISTLMAELEAAKQHAVPKNTIIDWYGTCRANTVPYGFLPCGMFGNDLTTDALRDSEKAAWETRYPGISIARVGTNGAFLKISTFQGIEVPDLTDRFVVQAGFSYAKAETGGAAAVTLAKEQCALPEHTHNYTASYSGTISDTGTTGGTIVRREGNNSVTNATAMSPASQNTAEQAHENRPPFFALYKLIKVI